MLLVDHIFPKLVEPLTHTVELKWLEHLWNQEKKFETGVIELMSVNYNLRSGGIIGIYFQFSLT